MHQIEALQGELGSVQNEAARLTRALSDAVVKYHDADGVIHELSRQIAELKSDMESARHSAEPLSADEPRDDQSAHLAKGEEKGAEERATGRIHLPQCDQLRQLASELSSAQDESRRFAEALGQTVGELKAQLTAARNAAERLLAKRDEGILQKQASIEEEEGGTAAEAGNGRTSLSAWGGESYGAASGGTGNVTGEARQLRRELSSARDEASGLSVALKQAFSRQEDDFQQLAGLEQARVEALRAASEAGVALQQLACEVSKLHRELRSAQSGAGGFCNAGTVVMEDDVHVAGKVAQHPRGSSAGEAIEELKSTIEQLRTELLSSEEAARDLGRSTRELEQIQAALNVETAKDALRSIEDNNRGVRKLETELAAALEDKDRAVRYLESKRAEEVAATDEDARRAKATIDDLNRQIKELKDTIDTQDRETNDLRGEVDRAFREKKEFIADHEARRECELLDLKLAVEALTQTFGDRSGTGPGLPECVEEIRQLREAHLTELREADTAVRGLRGIVTKLKRQLGAARSTSSSRSSETGEEEDAAKHPSKSGASGSGGELRIRKVLGRIEKLGVELGSARNRAVELSATGARPVQRRVSVPDVSVAYAQGLRTQVFVSYLVCLIVITGWLYGTG
jgi:chromosome segregation ATPase